LCHSLGFVAAAPLRVVVAAVAVAALVGSIDLLVVPVAALVDDAVVPALAPVEICDPSLLLACRLDSIDAISLASFLVISCDFSIPRLVE